MEPKKAKVTPALDHSLAVPGDYSHKPSSRLPLLSTRPVAEHLRPLASTKLYYSVMET